jgi:CheY-like chemotaxis protein
MQMPEMDGEQTLRAIKADPELKDVLVVVLTSIGIRGDVARLEALGCAGYLIKPVKQSQLFDTIITVWGRQKTVVKEKPSTIVTRHTIAEQKRQRVRILSAEDNPMNQKLVVILLKKAGYSVDAVENGRRAIQSLKLKAYDLILMDVQMPEMNGFEATKAIREMEGGKQHTPIIAMTAHAMKGDRERCLEAGMDDYVSKPIDPNELFAKVEKWSKTTLSKKSSHSNKSSVRQRQAKGFPLDIQSAMNRVGEDKELFQNILQEFMRYLPDQLQKLNNAINKGDAKEVEREAHSLKGASANLSANALVEWASQLELLGKKFDLADAKKMMENLKTDAEQLKTYVEEVLGEATSIKTQN